MKKIMFNDKYLLTQAVQRGEKTQTRRIVKEGTPLGNFEETMKYAPYKVGEVVAVAQSYKIMYAEMIDDFAKHNYHLLREESAENFKKHYENTAGWDNKMFVKAELMPHHIRITDVKVERLQSIPEEDALKEGICELAFDYYLPNGYEKSFSMPREAFAYLIDKVSGKGTWESNPYVWVYDFELVK
nr:MAG TPA: ASCH domain protein [Caudoviricetes sp.]